MKPRPLHAFIALTLLGVTLAAIALTTGLHSLLELSALLGVGGTTLTIGEALHEAREARRTASQPTPTPTTNLRIDGQLLPDAQLTMPADTEALVLVRRIPHPTDPDAGLLVQIAIAEDSEFTVDQVEQAIFDALVAPDWHVDKSI